MLGTDCAIPRPLVTLIVTFPSPRVRREFQLDSRPAGGLRSGYSDLPGGGQAALAAPSLWNLPHPLGSMAMGHFDRVLCCLEAEGETMAACGPVRSNSPSGFAEGTAVTALQGRLSPEGLSCFRPPCATHVCEGSDDIRTVQELLGHRDVSATMNYTHVLNRGGKGMRSPADAMAQRLSPSQL